jgi:hypothetical protein
MTWQRRLADMILAGGAIAALGSCSSTGSGGVGCCNANGDPCCEYKHCGGPLTPECACQMDGGTWNATVSEAGVYGGTCGPASPSDANASD